MGETVPFDKTVWFDTAEQKMVYPDLNRLVFALVESSVVGAAPAVEVVRRVWNENPEDPQMSWELMMPVCDWRHVSIRDRAIPLPAHLKIISWRYPTRDEVDER